MGDYFNTFHRAFWYIELIQVYSSFQLGEVLGAGSVGCVGYMESLGCVGGEERQGSVAERDSFLPQGQTVSQLAF